MTPILRDLSLKLARHVLSEASAGRQVSPSDCDALAEAVIDDLASPEVRAAIRTLACGPSAKALSAKLLAEDVLRSATPPGHHPRCKAVDTSRVGPSCDGCLAELDADRREHDRKANVLGMPRRGSP